MFYNLKIILRNLRRNFTYSAINIAGLAIGITASVLIFLWVYHERSFDTCYPDTSRIYRIINTNEFGGKTESTASVSMPFFQVCEKEIPEIEAIAVYCYMQQVDAITVNNTVFSVKGDAFGVNKAWLELFHSTILDGSFDAYDNHPFSVALTESGAKKYFGDSRPIGQIIRIDGTDYTVQAVVKDNPSNSSFRYHIMVSTNAILADPKQRRNLEQWGWEMWTAFVKLRPDADESQVSKKMNDITVKGKYREKMEMSLQPLTDMHFSEVESFINGGNAKMVSIFSLLGILLLCTACINYINLTTAKVTHRVKEVGIKKIVGAKRRSLFLQFVAESFIVSLVATIIALYLIRLLIPLYQTLVGDISVSFSSPAIWIITGIALLFVTILNGIYPALMLSSFHPMNTLKGISFPKVKESNLRRGLVVFQFFLSAALIISVIVIFKQTQYMQNIDPGFHKNNIVRIELPFRTLFSSGSDKALQSLQTIKGEMLSRPDVASVSLSNEHIENNGNQYGEGNADWNGRTEDFKTIFCAFKVDEDFNRLFELQMNDGRWFNAGEADMQNVILNETAIRELKIIKPYIGQRFDLMGMHGNIIGVVKDFHFRSLHEKITPLVIYQQDPYKNILNIKIQEGKSAEVVKAMETIWSKFFPNDPFNYTFLDDAVTQLYQSDIRTSRMILIFSILAIVIAMLGLFGLSTFAVERRTKEIGIRKVLGASMSNIIQLLTHEFLVLVTIAFVVAVPVAWWAMNRWLESFAYRVNITAWIFIAGAIIILLIALIAVGWQAIKAATANPVKAISNSE